MIPQTELTGDDIIVRPLCADDVRPLYEAARESIPEVSVWLPWCHPNYTIEETEEFIASLGRGKANDEWYSFGIFDQATGRFLGGIGLNFINRVHQMANLGYWVRTNAAGRGVATSATRLVARFGFEHLGLRRIEIVAAVGNIASAWLRKPAPCAKAFCESVS